MKENVLKDAKQQRKKHRESGHWLHNSIAFDRDHYLDEKYKRLANKLFYSLQLKGGYKPEQKRRDFETLLANLFHQTKKPISISLNRNDWKHTQYSKTSYFIVPLICLLHGKKLINMGNRETAGSLS